MDSHENTSQKSNCLSKLRKLCKFSLRKKTLARNLLRPKGLNLVQESNVEFSKFKHYHGLGDQHCAKQKESNKPNPHQVRFTREDSFQSSRIFRDFETAINKFTDKCCQVCHVLLYEHQRFKFFLTDEKVPKNLPEELTFFCVCKPCNLYLCKNKGHQLPLAYWNYLILERIPGQVFALTQMNLGLIMKTLPFSKLLDFYSVYGCSVFEDQATSLDASDRLLNVLLKSMTLADVVNLSANFGNIESVWEHLPCKDHVNVLVWLIAIFRNVAESSQLRHNLPPRLNMEYPQFVAINSISRVIHASFNENNQIMFKTNRAGLQCCANALSAILLSHIIPPSRWSTNNCNEWLIMGDQLYETIRVLSEASRIKIPESGFLLVKNFNVIKHYFVAFGRTFSIRFDDDPAIFGNLSYRHNGLGMNLMVGLHRLFQHHSCGILIVSAKCYAVMKFEDKFYFANPHSCNEAGAPLWDRNGRACVVECDTLTEFHRVIKRVATSSNQLYTIDYIQVWNVNENLKNLELIQQGTKHFRKCSDSELPVNFINSIYSGVNFNHVLKVEELAFSSLFLCGKNSFQGERSKHMTLLQYFQARVLGVDPRFQLTDYLFYALLTLERYDIASGLSGVPTEQEQPETNNLRVHLNNLYGSSNYWRHAYYDLIAQVRSIGPPHFFITFSCNDLNWLDMRKALLVANGDANRDPDSLTTDDTQLLIEKHPAVACRHLTMRIAALLAFLKTDKEALGGAVVDHWWRLEFQGQGPPLLHVLVWIEHSLEFIVDHLDDVMSCALPRKPKLRKLVQTLQVHRHDQTCTVNSASTYCRLHFPRQVQKNTTVSSSMANNFFNNGGQFCALKRRHYERYVNNYNVTLLELWKASMDIRLCTSIEAFALYVTKYMFKNASSCLDQALKEAIKSLENMEAANFLNTFMVAQKICIEQQVSAFHCIFRLCHLTLHGSSRKCVFLKDQNTNLGDQKHRNDVSREENAIELYMNRPRQHPNYNFDNMCLMEFVMLFDLSCKKKHDQDHHDTNCFPDTSNGYLDSATKFLDLQTSYLDPATSFSDPGTNFLDSATNYLDSSNCSESETSSLNSKTSFSDSRTSYSDTPTGCLDSSTSSLDPSTSSLDPSTSFSDSLTNRLDSTTDTLDSTTSLSHSSSSFLTLQDEAKVGIRDIPAVVRVAFVDASEDPEKCYFSLLQQYYPFRSEEQLVAGFETAKESFMAKRESILLKREMMMEHLNHDQQLQMAFGRAQSIFNCN